MPNEGGRERLEEFLGCRRGGYLTVEKMKELLQTCSYEELYRAACELVEAGEIEELKNPAVDGPPTFPVHKRYRIPAAQRRDSLALLNGLHPLLWNGGYLERHPDELERWHPQLVQLSDWLRMSGAEGTKTPRERSFEVFGDEKLLDGSQDERGSRGLSSLLRACGVTEDELRIEPAPTTLECFTPSLEPGAALSLLVSENRDPWMHVRRLLLERGPGRLFGERVDGAVYGCGAAVLAKGVIDDLLCHLPDHGAVEIVYWGDADRAGINILERLAVSAPCPVRPFAGAYRLMLEKTRGTELPKSDDSRDLPDDGGMVAAALGPGEATALRAVLQGRLRLPQEALCLEDLERGWEGGR